MLAGGHADSAGRRGLAAPPAGRSSAANYDAARQVLIDNRLHREQAGYHVDHPAAPRRHRHARAGQSRLGPAPADHDPSSRQPRCRPVRGRTDRHRRRPRTALLQSRPAADQRLGQPSGRTSTSDASAAALPYPLQPDRRPARPARRPGGYVREWPRPDERAERHRSYALQWFGFAVASVAIWGYFLRCAAHDVSLMTPSPARPPGATGPADAAPGRRPARPALRHRRRGSSFRRLAARAAPRNHGQWSHRRHLPAADPAAWLALHGPAAASRPNCTASGCCC